MNPIPRSNMSTQPTSRRPVSARGKNNHYTASGVSDLLEDENNKYGFYGTGLAAHSRSGTDLE